ncbi:thiamine/thiamine pyrophosphate ABC transporter permease ThiP, partial [Escherichia coli]|nr:thiamine/thiamine pyrophosphate ABC transporter permease ThiP [Escherichia coli]
LLKLFASTLVLPVLVGVFGLLAIYGNSGLLAQWLQGFDTKLPFSIYGLNGILLAHVFFNLPYAARLLLQALESIPAEQHKLCSHLGMSHW